MKSQNRVSQLTLELYHYGLATRKERKLVENALVTDNKIRERYEEIQKSDQELSRLNIPEMPPALPLSLGKMVVVGCMATAGMLCAIIPAFRYLRNSSSSKDNVIAEETTPEIDVIEDIPDTEIAVSPEPPVEQEQLIAPEKQKIAEKPRTEPPVKTETVEQPNAGFSITITAEDGTPFAFTPDMFIGDPTEEQSESNISIPSGFNFIFDRMFENRELTFVIIPPRITIIGKNAFSGNPLLSVTIGANVVVENTAFPGAFAAAYNANGNAAGTYTRPDVDSEAWEKK